MLRSIKEVSQTSGMKDKDSNLIFTIIVNTCLQTPRSESKKSERAHLTITFYAQVMYI